jgi:hypothetical protein
MPISSIAVAWEQTEFLIKKIPSQMSVSLLQQSNCQPWRIFSREKVKCWNERKMQWHGRSGDAASLPMWEWRMCTKEKEHWISFSTVNDDAIFNREIFHALLCENDDTGSDTYSILYEYLFSRVLFEEIISTLQLLVEHSQTFSHFSLILLRANESCLLLHQCLTTVNKQSYSIPVKWKSHYVWTKFVCFVAIECQ